METQQLKDALKKHFSDMGKKGGKIRAKKYTKKQLQEWGAKGGRPRKVDKQVKIVSK